MKSVSAFFFGFPRRRLSSRAGFDPDDGFDIFVKE
jgi:hypothetical protein